MRAQPAVRASLLRCLAAIDMGAVREAGPDVDWRAAAGRVNTKDAEALEISHIVSKGTSVLVGPLVKCAPASRKRENELSSRCSCAGRLACWGTLPCEYLCVHESEVHSSRLHGV